MRFMRLENVVFETFLALMRVVLGLESNKS